MQKCTGIYRDVKAHSSETSSELYINWSALVSVSFLHSTLSSYSSFFTDARVILLIY